MQQALLKILEGTVASVPPQGGRKHPQQEYVQIDTTNVLFICGGAFEGLEDIIARRVNDNTMGFRADARSRKAGNIGEVLAKVMPTDLLRYGLIPEFVGRLPVVATLDALDEDALVKILTQPKNALIKQYQKLFEMEHVKLKFTDGSLVAIAREALRRKTGARGLRSILENAMLDIMYEVPSQTMVKEVVINEDVISRREKPIIVYENMAESA